MSAKTVELMPRSIQIAVDQYTKGLLSDEEMAEIIRSIYLNGATFEQASAMTDAMAKSGRQIKYPKSHDRVVDKHSTGGVGDKVTLVFGPLAAASGLQVGKISGRALGHTGGTVDKLNSIPGFRTDISFSEFLSIIKKTGLSVMSQTIELVPADKKIYDLRNRTDMIDSVPLIAASIMSKKIAAGAKHLVLDVKTGEGAFIRDQKTAVKLAKFMLEIAQLSGIKTSAVITSMHQPLGQAVGNRLEVMEAYQVLNGRGPADVTSISVKLVQEAHRTFGTEKTAASIKKHLKDGTAARVFLEWLKMQGGDPEYVKTLSASYTADKRGSVPSSDVLSKTVGTVTGFNTRRIGELVHFLEESKDPRDAFDAGILLHRKNGEEVKSGQPLMTVFAHDSKRRAQVVKMLAECVQIQRLKTSAPSFQIKSKLIQKVLRNF